MRVTRWKLILTCVCIYWYYSRKNHIPLVGFSFISDTIKDEFILYLIYFKLLGLIFSICAWTSYCFYLKSLVSTTWCEIWLIYRSGVAPSKQSLAFVFSYDCFSPYITAFDKVWHDLATVTFLYRYECNSTDLANTYELWEMCWTKNMREYNSSQVSKP